MIEFIYNDVDDLPKLLAMNGLVEFYEFNNNMVLTKVKNLIAVQSWRISLKLCELNELIVGKFSKTHYKSIVEPAVFKFLVSPEPEVRAGACKCIEGLGKSLTQEEVKGKLLPILKNLAQDESQYVKSEFFC
jgi:hypothetical protein